MCIERATRLVKSQQSAGMCIAWDHLQSGWGGVEFFWRQKWSFLVFVRSALGLQCLQFMG